MSFDILLDVSIGLVLVFTLFSLIASIFLEVVNAGLNRRGRMLELGLYRLLDGDAAISDRTNRQFFRTGFGGAFFRRAAYVSSPHRQKNWLGDRFFKLEIIKSLTDKGRLPSSIPPELFATGVLTLIEQDLGIEKADEDYAKKAKESGAGSRLANLVLELFPNQVVTRDILEKKLREYFEDAMDRVEGWFKRENQRWLLIIGLLIAISFNVNTIEVAIRLANDANLRDQYVSLATSSETMTLLEVETKKSATALTFRQGDDTENPAPALSENDAAIGNLAKERRDRADKIFKEVEKLGLPFGDCRGKFSPSSNTETADPPRGTDASLVREQIAEHANCKNSVFNGGLQFGATKIMGWVLTAFAISLGAPFWFELLSKLVAIRRAGGLRGEGKDKKKKTGDEGSGINPVTKAPDKPKPLDGVKTIAPENIGVPGAGSTKLSEFERISLTRDDIIDIQRMLGVAAQSQNGNLLDQATVEAIEAFQREKMRMTTPTGRLTPGQVLKLYEG